MESGPVASAQKDSRRGSAGFHGFWAYVIKLTSPPPAYDCCIAPLQVKADMASDSNLPEWRCNKELPPDFDMWVPCVDAHVCVCGRSEFAVTALHGILRASEVLATTFATTNRLQ